MQAEGQRVKDLLATIGYFDALNIIASDSTGLDEWLIQTKPNEIDKIWKRHSGWEKENTNNISTLLFQSGPIKGDLLTCIALLRESQLGALAGDLLFWKSRALSPTLRQVHYCSNFPVPLKKRDFCIVERCGSMEDQSIVLLNYNAKDHKLIQDEPTMSEEMFKVFQDSPFVHGEVIHSVYHLSQVDDEHIQLIRYFCLDMKMSWLMPRVLLDKGLVTVFKENATWLRSQLAQYPSLADMPEAYKKVAEEEPLYTLLKDTRN